MEQCQASILLTEEALLEALCFDYVVESPHSKLVDLFDAHDDDILIQECAWSFAHDSSVQLHSSSSYISEMFIQIPDHAVSSLFTANNCYSLLCLGAASCRWPEFHIFRRPDIFLGANGISSYSTFS